MIVGIVLIVASFNYDLIASQTLRLDLAVIAGVMAVTKIVAMLFYRLSQ